jgi:CP family cyanate transporter-like MFS transporter
LISCVMLSPLAGNFAVLAATRVAFACGATMILSATPTVVMRWFPQRELPTVNGLNVMAQSIGVSSSMYLGPRIAASGGWATALFTFGAAACVATVIWLVFGRESAGADAPAPTPFPIRALPAMLTDRPTIILGIGVAGALGTFITFTSWLPAYWQSAFGFTPEQAGTTGAILGGFGILGSLLGSTLPSRFPKRRPFLIVSGVLLPVFAVGCFLVNSPFVLLVAIPIFGILGWVFMPIVFTIPMELPNMTSDRVGVVIAIVLSAGNLSGFVFPLLVGYLRDLTGGFLLGFAICALMSLGLAAAGYLMPETGLRHVDTSKLAQAETIEATSL